MPTSVFPTRRFVYCLVTTVSFLRASPAYAQGPDPGQKLWLFRTLAVVSGNSYESDPAGFTAYSGVALEAGVTRTLGRLFAVEVSLRTESREVDREVPPAPDERWGSLELLPLNLTFQYRPLRFGRFHPYVGLGANLTVAWEKSGVLDSLDVEPHVGPAMQLGLDVDLGDAAVLDFGLRWNTLTSDIKLDGERVAELKIDPMSLGVGVGFRF